MKSGSNSSCFSTAILFAFVLLLIRFALPTVWKILATLFVEAFYFGFFVILVLLFVIGYFTYKNLSRNQKKSEAKKYERVTRVEQLYASIVEQLNRDMVVNQVSVEELLQSEILIRENLAALRSEIIRLKEFASPENQKSVGVQLREYQQQLRESKEPSAREILEQNLKMVEDKKSRIESALEDVRQKEGMVDLIYNSLTNVEEELKFGRPVTRLFPPEVYNRFGLTPPGEQTKLPPLTERSNE